MKKYTCIANEVIEAQKKLILPRLPKYEFVELRFEVKAIWAKTELFSTDHTALVP